MKLRYKLGAIGIILSGIWIYFQVSKKDPVTLPLPEKTVERIIVNPHKHTIMIKKPNLPDVETFLPEDSTTIDVNKDGKVIVTAPQEGIELLPFGGAGVSGTTAIILGVDLFYWKRLDIGPAYIVPLNTGWAQDGRLAIAASYTVWDNIRATCSIDPQGRVGVFATLRF